MEYLETRTPSTINPWLLQPRPQEAPARRLFVFHHAGGGASAYFSWAQAFAPDAEVSIVQLPGRENRRREAPYRRLVPLASDLAETLRPLLDGPFAFFGHSMGAFISFEVARVLRNRYGINPDHLFVSGFSAPHLARQEDPIHTLPDAAFVNALCRRYDGIPAVILQDPELLSLFLPILRADLELIETYRYVPGEPLACPLYALGGREDARLDDETLSAWRMHTVGGFQHRMFPGGHFYLQHAAGEIHSLIASNFLRAPVGAR